MKKPWFKGKLYIYEKVIRLDITECRAPDKPFYTEENPIYESDLLQVGQVGHFAFELITPHMQIYLPGTRDYYSGQGPWATEVNLCNLRIPVDVFINEYCKMYREVNCGEEPRIWRQYKFEKESVII